MRKLTLLIGVLLLVIAGVGLFSFLRTPWTTEFALNGPLEQGSLSSAHELPPIPEAEGSDKKSLLPGKSNSSEDIEKQKSLPSPPAVVKGIYATSWSAGSASRVKYLTDLIEGTELNAIVIDIKDYSGYVAYRTGVPEIAASGAEGDIRILRPNALIKTLHDKNIYVIGRISVFQDSILAKAHPELALKDKATGKLWLDRKELAWLDAAGREAWDYNILIGKDALSRGFDEINFDYIRFASDGDLSNISYPFWDERTPRSRVMKNFFKYLRENLPGAKISADLFGLVTVNRGDLGIGQVIEDGFEYFDFVSPMVYPSHYASGFLGYKNPAEHPYEIVKYSLETALARLRDFGLGGADATSTYATGTVAAREAPKDMRYKLRPWLQDFDLGAIYDASMVKSQIQAVYDSASSTPDLTSGWLLWDPSNNYTRGALEEE